MHLNNFIHVHYYILGPPSIPQFNPFYQSTCANAKDNFIVTLEGNPPTNTGGLSKEIEHYVPSECDWTTWI